MRRRLSNARRGVSLFVRMHKKCCFAAPVSGGHGSRASRLSLPWIIAARNNATTVVAMEMRDCLRDAYLRGGGKTATRPPVRSRPHFIVRGGLNTASLAWPTFPDAMVRGATGLQAAATLLDDRAAMISNGFFG
jgi:hypothetical protein